MKVHNNNKFNQIWIGNITLIYSDMSPWQKIELKWGILLKQAGLEWTEKEFIYQKNFKRKKEKSLKRRFYKHTHQKLHKIKVENTNAYTL